MVKSFKGWAREALQNIKRTVEQAHNILEDESGVDEHVTKVGYSILTIVIIGLVLGLAYSFVNKSFWPQVQNTLMNWFNFAG